MYISISLTIAQITEAEAELLRERYRRLANEKVDSLALEENMIKKARKMANDILSDKILLEKGRNEEESEILRLRKLEDEKETMIKELEYTEQQSTMARFELSELTKAHEQLVISLEEMKKNNHDTVEPVLEELRNEIEELQHQTEQTRLALEKEANQKKTLSSRIDDLDARKQAKVAELARNMEKLDKARDGPDRIRRQTVSISKTATTMSAELKATENKIKEYDTNLESKKQKRVEVEQLRASLSEKIELHKQTIEQRERDVATVESSLQMQKAKKHDLTTRKVELNVKKKEFESRYRHLSDQLGFVKKEYDNH